MTRAAYDTHHRRTLGVADEEPALLGARRLERGEVSDLLAQLIADRGSAYALGEEIGIDGARLAKMATGGGFTAELLKALYGPKGKIPALVFKRGPTSLRITDSDITAADITAIRAAEPGNVRAIRDDEAVNPLLPLDPAQLVDWRRCALAGANAELAATREKLAHMEADLARLRQFVSAGHAACDRLVDLVSALERVATADQAPAETFAA